MRVGGSVFRRSCPTLERLSLADLSAFTTLWVPNPRRTAKAAMPWANRVLAADNLGRDGALVLPKLIKDIPSDMFPAFKNSAANV